MSNKFLGLLMVPMVLGTIGMAHADLEQSATEVFNATLAETMKITESPDASLTADISVDDGTLSNPLKSVFDVETNIKDAKVYLSASVDTDTVPQNALFRIDNHTYVVLGNAGENQKPTIAAVEDCKLASPSVENNPNAIAYRFSRMIMPDDVQHHYDNTKNQIRYDLAGDASVGFATLQTPVSGTYSHKDTAGSYQASVTLSTASL